MPRTLGHDVEKLGWHPRKIQIPEEVEQFVPRGLVGELRGIEVALGTKHQAVRLVEPEPESGGTRHIDFFEEGRRSSRRDLGAIVVFAE